MQNSRLPGGVAGQRAPGNAASSSTPTASRPALTKKTTFGRADYFNIPVEQHVDTLVDTFHFDNGSSITICPDEDDQKGDPLQVPNPGYENFSLFPWWKQACESDNHYHVQTRRQGKNQEGLLVDPGAKDNLAGSAWMLRQAALAEKNGEHGLRRKQLTNQLSVEGVGQKSQECKDEGHVAICLSDGSRGDYVAPILEDSEVPALLGNRVLREKRGLLDCHNGRLIFVGPGGYSLRLSPGSRHYELEDSPSQHWLLPCTEWKQPRRQQNPEPLRNLVLTTDVEEVRQQAPEPPLE